MIIRKLFKFESSHVVRNCYSERCKYSVHGHSNIIEVKLHSEHLDNAQMVLDFGILKGTVKDLIDSFDHCHVLWGKDEPKYKSDLKRWCERWIETPLSPSAESLSIMFHFLISEIIRNTEYANNEGNIKVHSVIVHETATGYAEAFIEDVRPFVLKNELTFDSFIFSAMVKRDWTNHNMIEDLKNKKKWIMRPTQQQVVLK